uniref:Uncharacterized protein n=1 Tax=Pseudomonas fluorescens (strain SBW25) TaxID=216595 RepID=A0A0G4E524_PSEFS|nr:hypothetical protein [Pseudomonas fluorescens]CEK42274.1 hypothetical protein PQBR57_0321 [Pseudomonas fluorescens SBW25]
MANFTAVNKAIKKAWPTLDIQAVRCKGYVYFDGEDGFDKIGSIYSHPTSTATETMIRFCFRQIKQAIDDGNLTHEKSMRPLQSSEPS